MNRPLNYTTTIPVERTVGEVQRLLATHGCSAVAVHYDVDGRADGLSFTLRTPHGERAFHLPVPLDGVQTVLVRDTRAVATKQRKRADYYSDPAHAERVAWRVVKDLLEAQIAMIDANMATLDQVMLPFLRIDETRTLYEAYRDREDSLLAIEPARP